MKKYLVLALFTIFSIRAEQRAIPETVAAPETQTQIVYIPVPVQPQTPEYTDNQQQRDLFLAFMNIAGNFGKILLSPDDTPHVIEGVDNIIDAIMYVADVATRASSRSHNYNDFILAIAHYIQQQALLARDGESSLEGQAEQAEEITGREMLMELALQQ